MLRTCTAASQDPWNCTDEDFEAHFPKQPPFFTFPSPRKILIRSFRKSSVFMTERLSLRRKLIPGHNRGKRSLHPSPSTSRGRSKSRRKNIEIKSATKPVKSLTRCASAPAILFRVSEVKEESAVDRVSLECDEGVLTRGKTCGDVLSTSATSSNLSRSFRIYEESCVYDKEAKVVVNVTVEGSAGPIRVMVRLGSSVEDMINLIIQKYDKEGRRPKLGTINDVSFELHDSYFSLECLGKSDLIGDIGSRTFYLRTRKKTSAVIDPCTQSNQTASSLAIPEPVPATIGIDPTLHPALWYLPGFISMWICKLIRRFRKLLQILGCLQSG